jgi:regulatory protein
LRKRPDPTPDSGPESAAPDAEEIRARALAFLARREHSSAELSQKLRQRGYPDDLVQPVLDSLRSANQLSDDRYASEYVRVHVSRGQGPLKIRAALRQDGVTEDVIDAALDSVAEDWNSLAARVRTKRFGSHLPANFAERARQARFLESRGFSSEQVRAALGGDPDS